MKRILCTIAVLLCLFCFCPVFAQETGEEVQNDTQQYQDMLQSSGAGELMEEAPDKTQELLEEYGISSLDPQSILSLKPGDLFSLLWNLLVEQLKSPLRTVKGASRNRFLNDLCELSRCRNNIAMNVTHIS